MWRACFDLKTAREIADKLLSTAQAQDGGALRLQAHHAQWATLFNLGELTECCRQIDAGLALYDPAEHAAHATVYGGHDPKVCGHGEAALALWLLGFPAQARGRAEDALAWARSLNHPASLAHAYDYALMLYQYRREADTVLAGSERFIAFAGDNKLPHYRARGTLLRGWAMAALGDPETGIALMDNGLDAQRDTGIEDDFPMFLDMLAEACLMTRQLERCQATLEEALMLAERSGMRAWWAELIRRKGELLLAQGDANQAQAEQCFLEALDLAQGQDARSLALRACLSLARLRRHQGEREAAREPLSTILAGFTEGWRSADLMEARTLLDTLR
jgi:predicted ATPase